MPLPLFERCAAPARIQRLLVFAVLTLLLLFFFESSFFPDVSINPYTKEYVRQRAEYYLQWGPFEPMNIPGFVNTGLPGKRSCDTIRYNSSVGVQKSFHLNDDVRQIALALDSHPIVDYPDDIMSDPNLKVSDIVEKTWARLSGSSVWLSEQEVYLSVTRVIFCPTRTRSVPKMSFLRGQLFNSDWEPLENYNLTFNNKTFNFPLVFDVDAPWDKDGTLYGPEDPRIILEDNVPGAEPIIIFNMIAQRSDWKRAMYIFRPFTNYTTILTIKDAERQGTEKNWAPFFVPPPDVAIGVPREPNEYIHFIYSFKPLRILKCHLRCGDCEITYAQEVPQNFVSAHNEDGGSLRGGTNFVPVPIPASMNLDPKVRVYASFPRTNIERHCDAGSFYRPEFVVLINIGDHYHVAFASESLDFDNAILELGPEDDRCDKGRILIPNSIASWDTSNGQDVMSVTFSVNDETVQVSRVQGILSFIHNLPQFKGLLKKGGLHGVDADLMNMLSSWVGDDVRGCLVEAALNYTTAQQEITRPKGPAPIDPTKELLSKIHEEEEKEELALEDGEKEKAADEEENEDSEKTDEEDDGYTPLSKGKLSKVDNDNLKDTAPPIAGELKGKLPTAEQEEDEDEEDEEDGEDENEDGKDDEKDDEKEDNEDEEEEDPDLLEDDEFDELDDADEADELDEPDEPEKSDKLDKSGKSGKSGKPEKSGKLSEADEADELDEDDELGEDEDEDELDEFDEDEGIPDLVDEQKKKSLKDKEMSRDTERRRRNSKRDFINRHKRRHQS